MKKPPLPTQVKQLPVTQEAPPKQALPPDKPAHQLDEKQSASKLDASAQLSNLPVEIVYEAQTDSSQHEVKPGRGEVATLTGQYAHYLSVIWRRSGDSSEFVGHRCIRFLKQGIRMYKYMKNKATAAAVIPHLRMSNNGELKEI